MDEKPVFEAFAVDADERQNRSFACWRKDDGENPVPEAPLKIVAGRMASPESKMYVFTLRAADGSMIDCPMFKRDFRRCALEWGLKPAAWGYVEFFDNGFARYELRPMDPQPRDPEMVV